MLIKTNLIKTRTSELPSLPPHCRCLCHHVGLLFCRQGLKRKTGRHTILQLWSNKRNDFEWLKGLGDSHLWRGACQPVLCSAHHICQGDLYLFSMWAGPSLFFSSWWSIIGRLGWKRKSPWPLWPRTSDFVSGETSLSKRLINEEESLMK